MLEVEVERVPRESMASTEKALSVLVESLVVESSSLAERITDWMPIGLMKYCTGFPGMFVCNGPYAR